VLVRRSRLLLAAGCLAPVLAVPCPVAAATPASPGGRLPAATLTTLQGDDVYESSGLVDRGPTLYTINDSGDAAVVYGVDARTGETVSRTTYAPSVHDVEALAPGVDGTVWAGDIGDNRADRNSIAVYRVRPVGGDRPAAAHPLRYPDGPRDAETLLVQPHTQRVFVVSKSVFGGTVYAAPTRLRAGGSPQELTEFAHVGGLVTDGTFLPDGRHVLLRTYTSASVYTFPAFALVGTVRLPRQPQGEGISASRTGRVLLSTEGVHTPILQVRLPASLLDGTAQSGEPDASAPPTRAPAPDARADPQDHPDHRRRDAGAWAGIALVALALAGAAYLASRGGRRG
jgi:hypothetical protein